MQRLHLHHGTNPSDRTIEQLLESCFILLDKSPGPSSHQVSAWARDMMGLEKLGHGGTLDPFASGLLPLLFWESNAPNWKNTHARQIIPCFFKFGKKLESNEIEEKMAMLTGKVYNVPPEISAVRVQVRTRKFSKFEILDFDGTSLLTHIECEAGTYVRTMARDFGIATRYSCGIEGTAKADIWRIQSQPINHNATISRCLLAVERKRRRNAMLRILHPIEDMLSDLPRVVVKDGAAAALSHGAPLLRPGVVSIDEDLKLVVKCCL